MNGDMYDIERYDHKMLIPRIYQMIDYRYDPTLQYMVSYENIVYIRTTSLSSPNYHEENLHPIMLYHVEYGRDIALEVDTKLIW
jgi:hypothetical protein